MQGEVEVEVEEVKLLAQGGYNNVWLISFTTRPEVSAADMSSSGLGPLFVPYLTAIGTARPITAPKIHTP